MPEPGARPRWEKVPVLDPHVVAGMIADPATPIWAVQLLGGGDPDAVDFGGRHGGVSLTGTLVHMASSYRADPAAAPASSQHVATVLVERIVDGAPSESAAIATLSARLAPPIVDAITDEITTNHFVPNADNRRMPYPGEPWNVGLDLLNKWVTALIWAPELSDRSMAAILRCDPYASDLALHTNCPTNLVRGRAEQLIPYLEHSPSSWSLGPTAPTDRPREYAKALAANPALLLSADEEESYDDLVRRFAASDPNVAVALMQNPAIGPLFLDEMSRSTSKKVRLAVAENPRTPLPVLVDLATANTSEVQRTAMSSQRIAAMHGYGDDRQFHIWRQQAAAHPKLTLAKFLRHLEGLRST